MKGGEKERERERESVCVPSSVSVQLAFRPTLAFFSSNSTYSSGRPSVVKSGLLLLLLLEEVEAMESKNEGSLFKSLFLQNTFASLACTFPSPSASPLRVGLLFQIFQMFR